MMDEARIFYEEKITSHTKKSDLLNKKSNIIGWSKLTILILIIAMDYFFYKKNNYSDIFITSIIGLLVFLILVFYHNRILILKEKEDILIEINKKGIKRLKENIENLKMKEKNL